jgi:hypothetical protein
MRGRKPLIFLITFMFAGLVSQSPATADAGITSYSDWKWSVDGTNATPWVFGMMQGTGWHYEGGGYSGISARVQGNGLAESNVSLQRDLSWVNDGYVTVATVEQSEGWERDNKRYVISCGQYIRYRLWDGDGLYSAKIYPGRGTSGEPC